MSRHRRGDFADSGFSSPQGYRMPDGSYRAGHPENYLRDLPGDNRWQLADLRPDAFAESLKPYFPDDESFTLYYKIATRECSIRNAAK